MLLLAIPVFILSYLAGRLTEDMGCLFATLGALLVGFAAFLLAPNVDPGTGIGGGTYEFWLLVVFVSLVPPVLLNAAAGLAGYHLGQRHRPPPPDDE